MAHVRAKARSSAAARVNQRSARVFAEPGAGERAHAGGGELCELAAGGDPGRNHQPGHSEGEGYRGDMRVPRFLATGDRARAGLCGGWTRGRAGAGANEVVPTAVRYA